ncbi:MAG TPA: hypothetical protein VGY56_14140 [Verrucomicrobiae bacterium]|nr:hypothetical protein [Verrucomicrobiae bacterium]
MRPSKSELILVIAALLCGRAAAASDAAPVVPAGNLPASQIFEKVRENYASLSSYSDQGKISTTMDGVVITTEFTTRLARPNLYRIEWDRYANPPSSTDNTAIRGTWSSGAGDYVQTGLGMLRQPSRDIGFAKVAASSSAGLVAVPGMFFDAQGSGQPAETINLDRLADDKVNNIECYHLVGELASGETNSFWIGKRDFLIHQFRTDVSPKVMTAALGGLTGQVWEPMNDFHGFSSIEMFTNIVVNKQFSRADFVPSFPLFTRSVYP